MKKKDKKIVSNMKEKLLNTSSKDSTIPYFLGSITQKSYTRYLGNLGINNALEGLINVKKNLKNGNLDFVEHILMIQAQTLDVIFNKLAFEASNVEWVNQVEPLLRLALKAQSQCRTTLETLAYIKNPPHVSFVKQANIANNQQVNNGAHQKTFAREIKNQQNQLLEANHGERLDLGAKSSSIAIDKELAAMG